jgi:hypothetical protein
MLSGPDCPGPHSATSPLAYNIQLLDDVGQGGVGLLVHGVHPVHEDVNRGLPGHVHPAVGGLEPGRDLHFVNEV